MYNPESRRNSDKSSMILKRSCNLTFGHAFDNIWITGIDNAEAAFSVVFATNSSKVNIASIVMVNSNLGQYCIVFDLRLSDWRAVVGNDDLLTFRVHQGLEDGFVSQGVFPTFHDESECCWCSHGPSLFSLRPPWLNIWSCTHQLNN